jgi:hypothetical protein
MLVLILCILLGENVKYFHGIDLRCHYIHIQFTGDRDRG